jgi:hypothetical protein
MKSKTHAGTGPYEGMFWNGKQWIGEPTEAALELRRQQGLVGGAAQGQAGGLPMTRDQRLLQAVVYAVLAVVCTTAAIPLVLAFGLAAGAVVTLAALGAGGIFAIVAFVKAS